MSKYTDALAENINSLDYEEARTYLLNSGYISDKQLLPAFVTPSGLEQLELDSLDWGKSEKIPITKGISIMTPKGAKGLRIYSLVHPFMYWHIVDMLTHDASTWLEIQQRLTAETEVQVYSLPAFGKAISVSEGTVKNPWVHLTEIDIIESSIEYDCLASLDIQSFYNSVYTHSISWAFHGQAVAKSNRRDYRLVGNRFDKLFQNSNDGQTNGIPTGNNASDIIAEIILKEIDKKISGTLRKLGAKAYRYRDDYKFLCKSENDANTLIHELTLHLHEDFNLSPNTLKTKVENDPIIDSLKSWHVALLKSPALFQASSSIPNIIDGKALFNILVASHQYQQRSGSNFGRSFLMNLLKQVNEPDISLEDPGEYLGPIISLLVRLTSLNYELTSLVFAIIEKLLNISDSDKREATLRRIVGAYDHQISPLHELWLYRLALKVSEREANTILQASRSPIMQMIKNETSPDYLFYEAAKAFPSPARDKLATFSLVNMSGVEQAREESISEEFESLEEWHWYE